MSDRSRFLSIQMGGRPLQRVYWRFDSFIRREASSMVEAYKHSSLGRAKPLSGLGHRFDSDCLPNASTKRTSLL